MDRFGRGTISSTLAAARESLQGSQALPPVSRPSMREPLRPTTPSVHQRSLVSEDSWRPSTADIKSRGPRVQTPVISAPVERRPSSRQVAPSPSTDSFGANWSDMCFLIREYGTSITGDQATQVYTLFKAIGRGLSQRRTECDYLLGALSDLLVTPDNAAKITLARCIAHLDANGNAAQLAARAVYRLSTDGGNDLLLSASAVAVVRSFLRRSTDPDVLVHACGVLKHLSSNTATRSAVDGALAEITQILLSLSDTTHATDAWASVATVAATVVRNLAEGGSGKDSGELLSQAAPALCRVLTVFPSRKETVIACARGLSKLSLDGRARAAIANTDCLSGMVMALQESFEHEAVVARLCYALSNLTYSNDSNRNILVSSQIVPALFRILSVYLGSELLGARVDAVSKTVRVLANLAANKDIGSLIAGLDEVNMFVRLLQTVSDSQQTETDLAREELLFVAAFAVANVVCAASPKNKLTAQGVELGKAVYRLLLHPNPEIIAMAATCLSVLFSRPAIAPALCQLNVHEALVILLDHDDFDVLRNVCGALCNLAGNIDCRDELQPCGGLDKLMESLPYVAEQQQTDVALLILRALYNFGNENTTSFFTMEQQDVLADILEGVEQMMNTLSTDGQTPLLKDETGELFAVTLRLKRLLSAADQSLTQSDLVPL